MNGTGAEQTSSRDAKHWATPVSKLQAEDVPSGAANWNVDGRQVVGPLQGFGPLWQKTYQVRLSGADVNPNQAVSYLKDTLSELMPDDSRFYPPVSGVEPGNVAFFDSSVPGLPGGLTTGVLVLYSDEESFTLMTPEGHPEAGWNTFSAFDDDGTTIVQIQSLARSNDPLFELVFRIMGAARQEAIWGHVLHGLAEHYGVAGQVETRRTLVDSKMQWGQAKNIWYNSAIRSTLDAPARIFRGIRSSD